MPMSHDKPKTFSGRLLSWLGMLHPAVIHFPIALALTISLILVQAYFGAEITYGAGHLRF